MSIQTYSDLWPPNKVVPFQSFQAAGVHMKQGTKHVWSQHCSGDNPLLSTHSGPPAPSSASSVCLSALLPSSFPSVKTRQTAASFGQRPPPGMKHGGQKWLQTSLLMGMSLGVLFEPTKARFNSLFVTLFVVTSRKKLEYSTLNQLNCFLTGVS